MRIFVLGGRAVYQADLAGSPGIDEAGVPTVARSTVPRPAMLTPVSQAVRADDLAETSRPWALIGRSFLDNKIAMLGAVLVVLVIGFCFIGPLIYPTNQLQPNLLQLNGPLARRRRVSDLRRNLQMMFQDPYSSLDPRMRVGGMLREPQVIQSVGTSGQRTEKVAAQLHEERVAPASAAAPPGPTVVSPWPPEPPGPPMKPGTAARTALGAATIMTVSRSRITATTARVR